MVRREDRIRCNTGLDDIVDLQLTGRRFYGGAVPNNKKPYPLLGIDLQPPLGFQKRKRQPVTSRSRLHASLQPGLLLSLSRCMRITNLTFSSLDFEPLA